MSGEFQPAFLSLEHLMVLHRTSLHEHGGIDGVRDMGAVESALASAKNAWFYAYGDLYDVAAAYAYHIAQSQAFLDGNKRTAMSATIVFLVVNDCEDRGDDERLHDAMIAIARREMDKTGLAALLREQFPKR